MSNAASCEGSGNRTDWLYYSRAETKSVSGPVRGREMLGYMPPFPGPLAPSYSASVTDIRHHRERAANVLGRSGLRGVRERFRS